MIIENVFVKYGIEQIVLRSDYNVNASSVSYYENTAQTIVSYIKDATLVDFQQGQYIFRLDGDIISSNERENPPVLEWNSLILDGTFQVKYDDSEQPVYDFAWDTNSMVGDNLTANESITLTFNNAISFSNFTINFFKNNIASDLTITYYLYNEIVSTQTITNNTSENLGVSFAEAENIDKIVFSITKLTNNKRRVRIANINLNALLLFDKDDIISISASKVTDLSADYDRCGAINVSVFNTKLDIKDIRDLPIEQQSGVKITAFIKTRTSYDDEVFGVYYSEDIEVKDNGKILTLTGYDLLAQLNKTTYSKGIVYTSGRSLGAWAEDVASDCGVQIIIANDFYNIISKGYIPEVPHREAFRLICEAGMGIMYVDKNGVIHLDKPSLAEDNALTDDDIVDNTISFEDVNKYLGVSVTEHSFIVSQNAVELGYVEELLLTANAQKVDITYSQFPVDVSTVQAFVDGSVATITSSNVYSDHIVLYIEGTANTTTFVTITGKPYNKSSIDTIVGVSDENSLKSIKSNYLITDGLSSDIANYQYDKDCQKYTYSGQVLSDDDFDLGDKINLANQDICIEEVSFSIDANNNDVVIKGVEIND